MKVAKQSNLIASKEDVKKHLVEVDADLTSLFLALQGRVTFGSGSDGARGENIAGEFQVYTTNATPDTEDTIAHTLGVAPQGFIVLNRDKAGVVYDSGTSWTSSNIYLKCNVASTAVTIFLLK